MPFSNAAVLLLIALMLGALWLAFSRFRFRADLNWPMVYYFALVSWHLAHPLQVNEYLVYLAVVSALFLRFEFMSERFAMVFKVLEAGCLLALAWRFFQLTMGYP
jgi:hypothetical protein